MINNSHYYNKKYMNENNINKNDIHSILDYLCQQFKITDYLSSIGTELIKSGQRLKCRCPLPDHPNDNDPSFYIRELENGQQIFKCFGCGTSGNIITLIRIIEKFAKNGQVIKKLADSSGIKIGKFDPNIIKLEPLSDDIIASFCQEDWLVQRISSYAESFIRAHNGSPDSVNRISKVYKFMDELIDIGDKEAMSKALKKMIEVISKYRA